MNVKEEIILLQKIKKLQLINWNLVSIVDFAKNTLYIKRLNK